MADRTLVDTHQVDNSGETPPDGEAASVPRVRRRRSRDETVSEAAETSEEAPRGARRRTTAPRRARTNGRRRELDDELDRGVTATDPAESLASAAADAEADATPPRRRRSRSQDRDESREAPSSDRDESERDASGRDRDASDESSGADDSSSDDADSSERGPSYASDRDSSDRDASDRDSSDGDSSDRYSTSRDSSESFARDQESPDAYGADEGSSDGGDSYESDESDDEEEDEAEPRRVAESSGPKPPVCEFAARLSDRAIQRITGGNAFLRGRIYARRNAVDLLEAEGNDSAAEIRVRNQEEPYRPKVHVEGDGKITSTCTCPGWRGPTGHCKHVAALLVALRDRERPPRPKPEVGGSAPPRTNGRSSDLGRSDLGRSDLGRADLGRGDLGRAELSRAQLAPLHTPQTVSVGGKRRRSRRRRRGATAEGVKVEVLSPREIGGPPIQDRGALETWLPSDVLVRPLDFEYRLAVRSASIAVTPVPAGSRTAVPIADALSAFNMISVADRPIFRALARHATRGQPATAELRGEDAAELLSMLVKRRLLLEPASMELRFHLNEVLTPSIDLDLAGGDAVRIRVLFTAANRRFPLSMGAWFEGTPGWHIDVIDGVARPLAEEVTPAWLQRLYRSPALVHPVSDLPRLLTDFVPKVANSVGADLPDLSSVADVVDAPAMFQLKANGDIVHAEVRLKVTYKNHEFDVPPRGIPAPLAFLPPAHDGGRPRVVRRDVGAEMAAVQKLLDLDFTVDESGTALSVRGDDAISFWSEGIGTLPEDWDRFIPNDLVDVTIRDESVTPQMRVSSGVDWLSLDLSFDAGGVAVDENELRLCLEKNRRLVKLADGTYAPIEREQVGEVMMRLAEIVSTSGGGKKIPLSQAGRVQDLLRVVNRSNVAPKALTLFDKLEKLDEIEQLPKPRALKAKLRDYQKKGFSWLGFIHELGSGGILADDMGLGKTVQAIALLLHLKGKDKHRPTLVVAPTSVVPNWQREIEKFAPSLKTLLWQGPNRHDLKDEVPDTDVMITSYALLRRDEEFLEKNEFNYVILDEAQHIKNPLSATARAAKKLKSERRLALTGTPIENRLSEFWSIIDFVSPGLLGDLKSFEERVARPIERGDDETAKKLRATIAPFVLRRTKEQVAPELPPKIEQEILVPLADEQGKLYSQILREIRKSVFSEIEKQGISKAQIQILAALTRLRQVACDPRLMKLAESENWSHDTSGKLGALREIVQEAVAGGHRVLVFSQFVEMLKHIKSALDEDKVTYEYLDGSTKDRLDKVDRFNDDSTVPVFLISLKAGGTGLNLTGADTVVHFDPWWNPAVEDQATDRAHRIGQTKTVNVYKLIAKGTVEEKILQLSEKKRALVANVLSTEGSPLKGLSKEDLDDLFSE
jgi:superfamily II DNA or RNA helicase